MSDNTSFITSRHFGHFHLSRLRTIYVLIKYMTHFKAAKVRYEIWKLRCSNVTFFCQWPSKFNQRENFQITDLDVVIYTNIAASNSTQSKQRQHANTWRQLELRQGHFLLIQLVSVDNWHDNFRFYFLILFNITKNVIILLDYRHILFVFLRYWLLKNTRACKTVFRMQAMIRSLD